jgi:ubiquinol-cytochrome c reductase cytochrome c subunit
MKHLSMLAAVAAAALLLDGFLGTQSVHAQTAGNATAGKAAFMHAGCYECHGTLGQGNFGAGPAIAPHPIPYANFIAYIRAPRGDMPPFDAHVLAEDDAQNIFAYLQSIPSGPSASSIPVLAAIENGNAGSPAPVSAQVAHGREIFTTYCVKCHVSAPIGPSLTNLKAHEGLAMIRNQIKNPAPPMPKLVPATLSDADADDVAAYVETL